MVSITWAVLQNVENRHTGKFFNFKKNTLDKPKVYNAYTNFHRFFAFLLYLINFFRANILLSFVNYKFFLQDFKCIFQNFGFWWEKYVSSEPDVNLSNKPSKFQIFHLLPISNCNIYITPIFMYVVTLFDISNPEQPVKLNFRTTSILPSPFSLFRNNKKVCAQQNASKYATLHF